MNHTETQHILYIDGATSQRFQQEIHAALRHKWNLKDTEDIPVSYDLSELWGMADAHQTKITIRVAQPHQLQDAVNTITEVFSRHGHPSTDF